MTEDELTALEREGWDALSTDGETARAFYDRVLGHVPTRRRDGQRYSALMSSFYVRRADGWKLAFHQQTPR